MWSVWSERVDLYLGRGLTIVRRRAEPFRILEHPTTWPLQRVLSGVLARLPVGETGPGFRRRMRLHITLSSAMCHLASFAVPQGLRKHGELQQLAQAAAAQAVGSSDPVIASDPFAPGLVASLGVHFMDDLHTWAQSCGAAVASVQPLWSLATQCALAKQRRIGGLALIEPDGVTLIANPAPRGDSVHAASHSGMVISLDPGAPVQPHILRWKIGNGLREGAVLTLKFGTETHGHSPSFPSAWAGCWSRP